MRFASLGSGSRGNATVVASGSTTVLIDCGFSAAETERRLARLGIEAAALDAILVTHEHGDHIAGVAVLARRHGLPVHLTAGTARHPKLAELPRLERFNSHRPFAIGDLEITPFPVPHDAAEPAQFVIGDGARRLGMLTDVGCWTPHIERQLSGCDALILECNHDERMLARGPYPPSLKRRVGGEHGHLSNGQAAHLLSRLDHGRLQHLVAAHLSEKNNEAALARRALSEAIGCQAQWIAVAAQDEGLDWRQVA